MGPESTFVISISEMFLPTPAPEQFCSVYTGCIRYTSAINTLTNSTTRAKRDQISLHRLFQIGIRFQPPFWPEHGRILPERLRSSMNDVWRHGNVYSCRYEPTRKDSATRWHHTRQHPRHRRMQPQSLFEARLKVFQVGSLSVRDRELESALIDGKFELVHNFAVDALVADDISQDGPHRNRRRIASSSEDGRRSDGHVAHRIELATRVLGREQFGQNIVTGVFTFLLFALELKGTFMDACSGVGSEGSSTDRCSTGSWSTQANLPPNDFRVARTHCPI